VLSVKEVAALKRFRTDASGFLKEEAKEPTLLAEVSTELEIHQALRRRGAAYALAQVMSFPKHEEIIALLFAELQRDPPSGFNRVTISQLQEADKLLHTKLAEATRAGLPLVSGKLPLDDLVGQVLSSAAVMWILMPSKRAGAAAAATVPPKKTQAVADGAKTEEDPAKPTKKTANKNKNKKRSPPVPKSLLGGVATDSDGNPLCFAYNLDQCTHKGPKCAKGRHVCCAEGCFQKHPFVKHK
jgi:hypothetical protein